MSANAIPKDPMDLHDICAIWPKLTGRPFDQLVADMKQHGLREPIITLDDKILDGANRFAACQTAGVEPRFEPYKGNDPLGFCISRNGARRHLTTSQRAMVAARIANCQWGGKRSAGRITSADAARMMNVSLGSVRRAEAVLNRGVPALADAVTQGKVLVRSADRVSRKSAKAQQKLVAKGPAAVKAAANPKSKPDALDHIHRFVDEMCCLDADRANRLATKAHALINDGLRWVIDHQASPDTSIVRLAPSSDRSPKPTLPRLAFLERPDLSQEAVEG
jgi:hypothetical protein